MKKKKKRKEGKWRGKVEGGFMLLSQGLGGKGGITWGSGDVESGRWSHVLWREEKVKGNIGRIWWLGSKHGMR